MSEYAVYVVNNGQRFYKGVTADLEKRLRYHNQGSSHWTKNKGPWRLVHTEEYTSKTEALKRERFLKSGKGREYLKSITGCGAVG